MSKRNGQIALGAAAALVAASTVYYLYKSRHQPEKVVELTSDDNESRSVPPPEVETVDNTKPPVAVTPKKPSVTPTAAGNTSDKELHARIEELDKKGKALFKSKQVRFLSLVKGVANNNKECQGVIGTQLLEGPSLA